MPRPPCLPAVPGAASLRSADLLDPNSADAGQVGDQLQTAAQAFHDPLQRAHDHDTLRDEPVLKFLAQWQVEDDPRASQPTISRFENSVTLAELQRLIDFTVDTDVKRLTGKHPRGRLPNRIMLDPDTTDGPTHGRQQLTLFHGYDDQYQSLPLIISEPTTKHVLLAWLRPGTLHPTRGADENLLRVAAKLRDRHLPTRR